MKMIKLTLLLALVYISYQTERTETALERLRRAEKNLVKRTLMQKTEKKVAKSLMARIFNVKVFVGEETTPSTLSFDAKDIKKPVENKVRGIYFTVPSSGLQESLKKLLISVAGSNFSYLAYRSIPQPITSTFNNGQAAFLSLSFQNGPAFTNIKVVFEYDPEWDVITSEELQLLTTWLNGWRVDRISVVGKLKKDAVEYASNYTTAKSAYESASKGVAGLQANIESNTKQIAQLQTELADNKKQIEDQIAKIQAKQSELDKLKQQQTEANGRVGQADKMIVASRQTYDTLLLQKNSGVADTSQFQETMTKNKDSFDFILSQIRQEYGNDATILDNARKALLETNPPNLAQCNDFLNKATPTV